MNLAYKHRALLDMQQMKAYIEDVLKNKTAAKNPTYGSQDICLTAKGDILAIQQEIGAKSYPVEKGIVKRYGALEEMKSIYLRDIDGNLIEIAVYDR